MRILNTICFLIIYLLINLPTHAQGICEDSKYKQGGFKLSSTDICHTETISIENTADVKNAIYYYKYTGQTYSEIFGTGSAEETLDYSQLTKSGVYTVVQVGEKDGEKTVACEEIKVRVADQPVFSYNFCYGHNIKEIVVYIPEHPVNNYSSYEITLNGEKHIINRAGTNRNFKALQNNTLSVKGVGGSCSSNNVDHSIDYNLRNGTSLEYFPNIDELRITDDNKISINFTGMDNHSYNLKRFLPNDTNTTFKPTVQTIEPNVKSIIDTPPNADKISYCYYIQKSPDPICGNYNLKSATICTAPLLELKALKNIKNELRLSNYEGPKEDKELPPNVFSISNDLQKTTGNSISYVNININSNLWTASDSQIDCTQEICYRMITEVSGNNAGAQFKSLIYSNEKCIDYKLEPFEAPKNVFVSTTDDQINNVVFLSNIGGEYFADRWVLYKQDQDAYIPIDSVYFGDSNLKYGLFDPDEVTQSEVYKVALIDECENSSKLSEPAHSIYLSQWNKNSLAWTTESPFSGEEPSFYFIDYLKNNQKIAQFEESGNTSIHKIDLNYFISYGDFRIKATSPTNKESFSNIITLPIYGDLFLPDVFTPNGDLKNDYLELKGKTEAIEELSLRIYTASGFNVADINNAIEKWDGLLPNGAPAAEGTYLFQLKAKMENGQIILKNGTFLLMR